MENASKALLIAGAIILAILLIAVGMYVFNFAQQPKELAVDKMDAIAKEAYNKDIAQYVKDNASANDVKSLIQSIISSNSANIDKSGNFIAVTYKKSESDTEESYGDPAHTDNDDTYVDDISNRLSKLKSSIVSSKKYNISATYGSGIITKVTITEVTK
ncbi:MAG: hypothetical protein IKG42_01780 [Clostridia bacterium]|nr:hypothetical protein [Clostridia bacterium]